MLLAFIAGFLITILSFSLGVIFFTFISRKEIFERVIERYDKVRPSKVIVGPIERPTATQVNKRGTIEEETEEAMAVELRKLFKNGPIGKS